MCYFDFNSQTCATQTDGRTLLFLELMLEPKIFVLNLYYERLWRDDPCPLFWWQQGWRWCLRTWVQNHKTVLKGGPDPSHMGKWPQGITHQCTMCPQIKHVRFLDFLDQKSWLTSRHVCGHVTRVTCILMIPVDSPWVVDVFRHWNFSICLKKIGVMGILVEGYNH